VHESPLFIITHSAYESQANSAAVVGHLRLTVATEVAGFATRPRPSLIAVGRSQRGVDSPAHAGLFELSEGRDLIVPDECESWHGLRLRLVLLIEHFLGQLGYVLNGEVSRTADDLNDRGSTFVKDNAIECADDFIDFIVNQGASWSLENYSDDRLKTMIRELIDSADSKGCSPDLTVVASKVVDSLREALSRF
jgi:hypothetical protein